MRLLVAHAAGGAPTQTLTGAFTTVAARSGQSLTVTDVAPPLPGDSMALSPFFVTLGVLFPSLAAGSTSALVFRRSRRAWCVAAPVVAAVVIGAVGAGVADGVSGLGHYPAIAGVIALFSPAVSAPTAVLGRIWPPLVAASVLAFVVLGIPVSGGPSGLAAFGPGFLRVFHPGLPLGLAADAVRSIVYFGGYGTATPLWTLAVWAVVGLGALVLVTTWRQSQKQKQRQSQRQALRAEAAATAESAEATASVDDGRGHHRAIASVPTQGPFPTAGIVVGFDDSGTARRALDEAVRLAAARHEIPHVVYSDHVIIDSDLSGFGHAEMEAARDRKATAVAEAVADIAAHAGIGYTFERSTSSPAEAILESAKALAATDESNPVIVVGRSGHATRHLLGSVPSHLLAHSPYPVLAVP